MIHRNPSLVHHLFQLAIRKRVRDVPSYSPQDDLLGKVTPLEFYLLPSFPHLLYAVRIAEER